MWTDASLVLRSALCLLLALTPLSAGSRPEGLSVEAKALVARAFEGLDPAKPVIDQHVHIVGNGSGTHGLEVHPEMQDPLSPLRRLAAKAYTRASGVQDPARFDAQYLERLVGLAQGFGRPVKLHILAMDHAYRPDGAIDRQRTEFRVPNDYVVALAERHPQFLVPVVSIHPDRKDAIPELEKWAARGVRHLKWLPNAQNIDPGAARHAPFYKRMKELGITLLTHAGEEKAVRAPGARELGNPLRLRVPLDAGVTVIVAHCASLGRCEDPDHPGKQAESFELFLRLMGEERYRGRLFGEISALTQVNRMPGPMLRLLADAELQGRVVNGSDYPLPAVDFVIWTSQMARRRMLTRAERRGLNEIFKANPLLFDFVLKRTIRDPKTGKQLYAALFQREI